LAGSAFHCREFHDTALLHAILRAKAEDGCFSPIYDSQRLLLFSAFRRFQLFADTACLKPPPIFATDIQVFPSPAFHFRFFSTGVADYTAIFFRVAIALLILS
jgi:hypothetical protein